VSALLVSLSKDFALQWRTRARAVAAFAFGAAALVLFSFATGPAADLLRPHAAGFLWIALLLASTLALADSFHLEMEDRALEGLLLLPAPAAVLFYAKALANWAQLLALAVALVPLAVVFLDAAPRRPLALLGVLALGTAGLSAPGTLYAAMTAQVRGSQALLPLLLFPLVVPVMLGAVRSTALLLTGDPMGQLRGWLTLLACFNAVYWPLCGLLFGRVVEDR
jgi:heme exporter protein B